MSMDGSGSMEAKERKPQVREQLTKLEKRLEVTGERIAGLKSRLSSVLFSAPPPNAEKKNEVELAPLAYDIEMLVQIVEDHNNSLDDILNRLEL